MTLSWKSRRRLSLLILVVALPLYIVVVVNVLALFDRPPFWVELAVYVILGIIWALPLKAVFRGVGQPDPDAEPTDEREGRR
jgi:hypothetical protein